MQRYSFAAKAFTRCLTLRSPSKPSSFALINNSQPLKTNPSNAKTSATAYNKQDFRLMSSNSGSNKSRGGTKAAVFGSVAVLSLFGGTLGYAGIDPEFRAYVEGVIPGAKEAFDAILGNVGQDEWASKTQTPALIEDGNQSKKIIQKATSIESAPPSKLKQINIETKKEPENTQVISPPLDLPPANSSVDIISETPMLPPPLPSTSHFPPPFEQVSPKSIVTKEETTGPSISVEKIPKEKEMNPTNIETDISKIEEGTSITDLNDEKRGPDVELDVGTDKDSMGMTNVDEIEPIHVQKLPPATEIKGVIIEIESAISEMNGLTDAAVEEGKLCQKAIQNHSILVEKVLERAVGDDNDADDGTWKDVFDAANQKTDHLGKAQEQIKKAKSAIKRALEAVETAKASENVKTATNPLVTEADELVNEALLKVQSVVQSLESAGKDSKLVEEYRDLVEEGRQQFRREIAALLPDTSPEEVSVRKGPLSEDELDVFVTHAYRKVCRLQQELAKQKTLAQQRLETSITDEQLRKQVVTEEVVHAELEAQRRQLEVEHQRKMAAIREEMENEVRSQLRRQAAAHSDHVKDAIEVEASELKRKHSHELEEKISTERSVHQKELSSLTGRVDGIKMVVRQRASIELKIRQAQELWLACKALSLALCAETTKNGILPPIQTEFNAIENVAARDVPVQGACEDNFLEKDDFVKTILSSIPTEALARGVYTDKTLRDRFFRVEKMANRTALVKEEDSSLLMYLLSYIQSFIMASPSTEKLPDTDSNLDLDSLSNYDALGLARGCVERGDIAQAVRYLTLLKGESANVSKDWIKEARLLLETQQACDALLAHAAAYGLETFPRRNEHPKEKVCCHSKS